MDYMPRVIENREFVDLEEEDIQRLNRDEARKFEENPDVGRVMATLEEELGPGRWEEHWLTVDASGRRVYAKVYYGEGRAMAMAADGQVFRELEYPPGE